jgi:hypothetical protein
MPNKLQSRVLIIHCRKRKKIQGAGERGTVKESGAIRSYKYVG